MADQLCEQLDRARYQQTESAGDVTLYPRRNYSTTNVLVAITPQIINNPSNTADFQTTSSNLHYNTSHSIICQVRSVCHTFQECNVGNINNKTSLGFAKIISAH